MRVLVTGSAGMLGSEVYRAYSAAGHVMLGTTHNGPGTRMDVTDPHLVDTIVTDFQPELIVHCAAYTAVDQAETDQDELFRVNETGSANIASAAESLNSATCFISTDYVFAGDNPNGYSASDRPNPINLYGASKLAGEAAVADLCARHFIVRTAWMFGPGHSNFPARIIGAARAGRHLKVVNDQRGSPTFTCDLARSLVRLTSTTDYGTYHMTNGGSASWFDVALQAVRSAGLNADLLESIPTAQWQSAARRPRYSVLLSQPEHEMRPWNEALDEYVTHYIGPYTDRASCV